MVAMNCFGLAKKMDKMEEENLFLDRSTSNRNLLAVMKAISMPEKKAENSMAIRMDTLKFNESTF